MPRFASNALRVEDADDYDQTEELILSGHYGTMNIDTRKRLERDALSLSVRELFARTEMLLAAASARSPV